MSDLVAFDGVKDPADSVDLLQQLEEINLDKIDNKLRIRTAEKLRVERDAEIYIEYKAKAKNYYETLWAKCEDSQVGHGFRNLDIKGYTVRVCETCGFPAEPETNSSTSSFRVYDDYRDNLVNTLCKQLRKLDEDAGILEVPKLEDFLDMKLKVKKENKPQSNNSNGGKVAGVKKSIAGFIDEVL